MYWAPTHCLAPECGVFEVTPGDQFSASPVALAPGSPGPLAFADAGAFRSQFGPHSLLLISDGGAVSVWATAIDGATGLLWTADERLLAASYFGREVVDATLGMALTGLGLRPLRACPSRR